MKFLRVKGIVIRENNTGEADKIITILSNTHGKISCYVKGARRTKSRFLASSQYLSYSEFFIYKTNDMYSVSSCELIESFYELRNDIIKLTYTAHLTDLLIDVLQEEQPAAKVLQLFLNSLYLISKTNKSIELIVRIFELRLLVLLGFAPYVKDCVKCGSKDLEKVFFDFSRCGFLCNDCVCKNDNILKIGSGTAKTIRHIVYSNINDLFKFDVSESILNELKQILKKYLKDRLEKEYTKLEYLKNITNFYQP